MWMLDKTSTHNKSAIFNTKKYHKNYYNGCEKSSVHVQKLFKNLSANEYQISGAGKQDNFSQKLHAVSHVSESSKPKTGRGKWNNPSTNDIIKERLNTEPNIYAQSWDDWKDLSSTVSENLKENQSEKKYNRKILNKWKSQNDDESKNNISSYTTVAQKKERKKSENLTHAKSSHKINKSSYSSGLSSIEKLAFGLKTDSNPTKNTNQNRLRSPNNQTSRIKNNITLPPKKNNCHRKSSKNEKVSFLHKFSNLGKRIWTS